MSDLYIQQLKNKLYEVGICPVCFGEITHEVNKPFAHCNCRTGEDTGQPPLIQQLRREIHTLRDNLKNSE